MMVRKWAIAYRTVRGADTANLEAEVFVGVAIVVLTVAALVSRYTFGYLRLEPVVFLLISQHRGDIHAHPQRSRMLYYLFCGHLGRKEQGVIQWDRDPRLAELTIIQDILKSIVEDWGPPEGRIVR